MHGCIQVKPFADVKEFSFVSVKMTFFFLGGGGGLVLLKNDR